MITVADILALPAVHTWELLGSGSAGLQRKVWNVGIMDAAMGDDAYADYRPGEFILTNLGFARDDPALADESLCAMVSRDHGSTRGAQYAWAAHNRGGRGGQQRIGHAAHRL